MQRRTFFGWLAGLFGAGATTTALQSSSAPMILPPPEPKPRPLYHRDGLPRWQHHAPTPMNPGVPNGAQRVAFLRRPARQERTATTNAEYRAAMEEATGKSFQPYHGHPDWAFHQPDDLAAIYEAKWQQELEDLRRLNALPRPAKS